MPLLSIKNVKSGMTDAGCEDDAGCCWDAAVCAAAAGCSPLTAVCWDSAVALADLTLFPQEIAAAVAKMPANVNKEVVRMIMDTKIGDYTESFRTKSWQV